MKPIRHIELSSEKFITLISNQRVEVYEDVQGARIFVSYRNGDWEIRPRRWNENSLNLKDLAVQKYYKWCYAYLLSLPNNVVDILHPNWQFVFEYFPDDQPANIKYDHSPKHGLILTGIFKYGKYWIEKRQELEVFAKLFDVELLPLIYSGVLNETQINKIYTFLSTSSEDLEFFFKDDSFAKFFYNLLNPNLEHSYLKNDWQSNLEKIIIKVENGTEIALHLLNPMYQSQDFKNEGQYSDIYSVLLLNFIQWLQTVQINEVEASGTSRDQVYINLVCKLFNAYIGKMQQQVLDFEFSIPVFFDKDKFKVNRDLIQNRSTVIWLGTHPKFEYLFKIIFNALQKERKREIGVINNTVLIYMNRLVRQIAIRVEEILNWNTKLDQFSHNQKDLSQFPNIKWEVDHYGKPKLERENDTVTDFVDKKKFKK